MPRDPGAFPVTGLESCTDVDSDVLGDETACASPEPIPRVASPSDPAMAVLLAIFLKSIMVSLSRATSHNRIHARSYSSRRL